MEQITKRKQRNTNLELFRIIVMLLVISHHYVVNSGLTDLINDSPLSANSIFLLLFGAWGKTTINCFVLITGYFMCKSKITVEKFLKLLLELEFYKIVIYLIFNLTGYEHFSFSGMLSAILPLSSVKSNFSGCYLLFYLFIPFLNILIQNLNQKMHGRLILICVFIYSILGTIPRVEVNMNYVSWFIILYLIAAYIRYYPNERLQNKRPCGVWLLCMIIISCLSIVGCAFYKPESGVYFFYHFLFDSNKLFALITSISAFLFFKNISIKHNSIVNTLAASTYGVLLIHSNSDTMRAWLWSEVFKNCEMYHSKWLIIHAITSVIAIFLVCSLIDHIRIILLEKPFFRILHQHIEQR